MDSGLQTENQLLVPKNEKYATETPAMRLFGLLEFIAGHDRSFTLQDLVDETTLPKPTLHRMLQQLEAGGMLQRDSDGRHYAIGTRLRNLAENVLLNDSRHGARRRVLRGLREEVGESCNITALSGDEVLYLDRVETAAPLRFYLHPGSRVPAHCSASGKLFLAQMSATQRRRLLGSGPFTRYTPNTIDNLDALEVELERVRQNGYAFDNEEFLSGLFCIAVLVPRENGKSNMGVAIQAPIMRMTPDKALLSLPALQRAAKALAAVENDRRES